MQRDMPARNLAAIGEAGSDIPFQPTRHSPEQPHTQSA